MRIRVNINLFCASARIHISAVSSAHWDEVLGRRGLDSRLLHILLFFSTSEKGAAIDEPGVIRVGPACVRDVEKGERKIR